MFKGVSWCIRTVSILYFGQFNSFPYPFPLTPIFQCYQYISLYPLPSQILYIMILLTLYHSFSCPSFPKFHSVVPLLQTYSTYMFVYDHVCFCVYSYLLDLHKFLISIWDYNNVLLGNLLVIEEIILMNEVSIFTCLSPLVNWDPKSIRPCATSQFLIFP
jgi:hypothetical protein